MSIWESSAMQNGVGGGGFTSPSTQKKETSRRMDMMVPVSCAVINELPAQQDALVYGTTEIHKLCVVGQVRMVDKQPMFVTYKVDDSLPGTNTVISVRQWSDDDDENVEIYQPNDWVRVHGNLRNFDNQTYLNAFMVRKVDNMDEVNAHRLEVQYAQLYYSKEIESRVKDMHASGLSAMSMGGNTNTMPSIDSSFRQLQQPQQNQMTHGLSGIQLQVKNIVCETDDPIGMHINNIMKKIPGGRKEAVKKALEDLCAEGFIYTTIDDDHYKSTDVY